MCLWSSALRLIGRSFSVNAFRFGGHYLSLPTSCDSHKPLANRGVSGNNFGRLCVSYDYAVLPGSGQWFAILTPCVIVIVVGAYVYVGVWCGVCTCMWLQRRACVGAATVWMCARACVCVGRTQSVFGLTRKLSDSIHRRCARAFVQWKTQPFRLFIFRFTQSMDASGALDGCLLD